jgi:hypothetical protein
MSDSEMHQGRFNNEPAVELTDFGLPILDFGFAGTLSIKSKIQNLKSKIQN